MCENSEVATPTLYNIIDARIQGGFHQTPQPTLLAADTYKALQQICLLPWQQTLS